MIRINLLPVRTVRRQEAGKRQLILLALLLLGAGVGNYFWYADRDSAHQKVAAKVASLKKEIADLDRIIGEVKNIASEKKALEQKLGVLDALRKGRVGPVKMLDAMTVAIPKNVWLRQMSEAAGVMTLEGSGLSNDDVAQFMKGLAAVVWTPEGMGNLAEPLRKEAETARVELLDSGQVKDLPQKSVVPFFSNIALRRSSLSGSGERQVVNFTLSLKANYAM